MRVGYAGLSLEELLELDDVLVVQQVQDVRLGICGRPIRFFFKGLHGELRAGLLFDDELDDSA